MGFIYKFVYIKLSIIYKGSLLIFCHYSLP
nr:MAG TPA: hypothetical protein [Caudoviricetes sp.]